MAYFKKNEALIELRKMLFKEKNDSMYGLGIALAFQMILGIFDFHQKVAFFLYVAYIQIS